MFSRACDNPVLLVGEHINNQRHLPLSRELLEMLWEASWHFLSSPRHIAHGRENVGGGSQRLKLAEQLQLPSKQKRPWHFPQLDLGFLCSWQPPLFGQPALMGLRASFSVCLLTCSAALLWAICWTCREVHGDVTGDGYASALHRAGTAGLRAHLVQGGSK